MRMRREGNVGYKGEGEMRTGFGDEIWRETTLKTKEQMRR
jgi:hypothetical protein